MHRKRVFIVVAALLWPGLALAQKPNRIEQKRREILEKLGLDKAPTLPPKPTPETATPETEAASDPAEVPSGSATQTPGATPKPTAPSFRRQIHPWLVKSCQGCHKKDGPAGGTALLLGERLAADYAGVRRLVNTATPPRSRLVLEATGHDHGGGVVAPAGGADIRRLLAWIGSGADLEDAPAPADAAAPSPPATPKAVPRTRRRTAAAPVTAPQPTEVPPAAVVEAAPVESAPPVPSAEPQREPASLPAFSQAVHGLLGARCRSCHNAKGVAARSSFVLAGDVAADYATALAKVKPGDAQASVLLAKAVGEAHMPVLARDSVEYSAIAAWIDAGAHGPFPAIATAGPTTGIDTGPIEPAPPQAASASSTAPTPPSVKSPPHPLGYVGGLNLPLGLRLNGRFDIAYERRGQSGPFSSGQTQFQNYHHFLFLSRDEADDPVTFTVELVALTFWEAHVRVTPREALVQVRLKLGKLIVPFGAEPLFHQSYGGLQGFDQRVLPIFWAQNGFGARLNTSVREVSVLADVYAVRGYALGEQDAVLNLQSNFSPTDDVRPAYGARLNLSWRSASGYYSLLVNGLGFGRTLVMQGLDLEMWRWHGIAGLERFTFGLGFLRADVSGGGAGSDYYHFASYYQARVYLGNGLYVQYRQGLRTFNNRRGFYQDNTRFTSEDGSSHNVGLVWRHHGLSVGAFQFWNLEKVNEVRDDFFRLLVAYDF